MPDKILYGIPIPRDAQTASTPQVRRNVSKQGTLQSGPAVAEPVSTQPGEQLLEGQFRARFSEPLAVGLEELFDAASIETVPFFTRDGQSKRDGYYALENVDTPPVDPRAQDVHQFDGRITRRGTKRTHYRALRVNGTDNSVTNPFGSATTEYVGLSAQATAVQWWDQDGGQRDTSPTVQETNAGEFGDLELYDATEPSFSGNEVYHLIYELPYEWEQKTDPRVWDDYGRAKEFTTSSGGGTVGSATVGTATVASTTTVNSTWGRVYDPGHEFRGKPVIENGLLRLRPDEDDGVLRAYTWNDTDKHWASKDLGLSDWRLVEWDIRRIGLSRIDSLVEFQDTSGSSTYHLNCSLKRGYTNALWYEPALESGSTPAGLNTRLSPIAHDSDRNPAAVATIVDRTEVKTQ